MYLTSARWKPWRLVLEGLKKEEYKILERMEDAEVIQDDVGPEEERKREEEGKRRRREVVAAGRGKLVGGGLPESTSAAGCLAGAAAFASAAASPEWALGLKRGPRGGVQAW